MSALYVNPFFCNIYQILNTDETEQAVDKGDSLLTLMVLYGLCCLDIVVYIEQRSGESRSSEVE